MLRLLAALVLLLPAWTGAAGLRPRQRQLRAAVFQGRYLEALRVFGALEAAGHADGPDDYFAGWTNMRLNRPERALAPLEKAAKAGWSPRGWKTAEELLAGARARLAALPPAVEVKGLDETLLQTYADCGAGLCGKILAAQPEFLSVGRGVFGGPPPPLRVYLFATHAAMDKLGTAMGDGRVGRRGSSGGYGFARLSAESLTRPVEDDSIGLALHETTHGWLATYLRDRFDRNVALPAYMDEGLANYVGSLWKYEERRQRLSDQRLSRIARWRAQNPGPPPALAELRPVASFHEDGRDMLDYDLATLLMERLLGPPETGAKRIPAVLNALAASGGDDAAAWKAATGKDVEAEYAALTRGLWAGAP